MDTPETKHIQLKGRSPVRHLPFFSVVIPMYNKGPHIVRAVASVLHQSFQDFELIVINDASTDNGLDELGRFDDPRIRVMHREKPGPGGYAARNLGIKHANAPWIAFLDADDSWDADHLLNMQRLSECFPEADMLACGWNVVHFSKSVPNNYYRTHHAMEPRIVSKLEFLRNIERGRSPIWMSSSVIRKRVFVEYGGFPEGKCMRGGDTVTWITLILHDCQLAWHPYLGANYYTDSVNRVSHTIPSSIYDSGPVRCIAEYLETCPGEPHRAQLLRAQSKYIYWNFQTRLLHAHISLHDILAVRRHASLAPFLLILLAFALPPSLRSSSLRFFHAMKERGLGMARHSLLKAQS